MSQPLEVVLIGAGQRGARAYGPYAHKHPEQLRFVAVAEPNPIRRQKFAEEHDIDDSRCFESWEELLAMGKLGQAAIVTTMDQMHVKPAIAAMEAGYHVLLEKPMADNLEGCVQLVRASERTGRLLQICHVLRYAPFWEKLNEIIASGQLGRIVTVEHRENVAFWHMAHSFVRGNWGNEATSTPMILAKCCHDLDLLYWNFGKAKRLHSFGSLLHYNSESAGPEIPLRCTDGCRIEEECVYSAKAIYLDLKPFEQAAKRNGTEYDSNRQEQLWPVNVISEDSSYEGRLKALQSGPYGRCVYHCDNTVVDNQVVTMEMESGATVTLIMHGHSHLEGRTVRIDGTRATLRAVIYPNQKEIKLHNHLTGETEVLNFEEMKAGHNGGDYNIMRDFVRSLQGEITPLTSARESLESHLMAFAAEESRHEAKVITMQEYRTKADRIGLKDRNLKITPSPELMRSFHSLERRSVSKTPARNMQ